MISPFENRAMNGQVQGRFKGDYGLTLSKQIDPIDK